MEFLVFPILQRSNGKMPRKPQRRCQNKRPTRRMDTVRVITLNESDRYVKRTMGEIEQWSMSIVQCQLGCCGQWFVIMMKGRVCLCGQDPKVRADSIFCGYLFVSDSKLFVVDRVRATDEFFWLGQTELAKWFRDWTRSTGIGRTVNWIQLFAHGISSN